jgi:hypothetical protein
VKTFAQFYTSATTAGAAPIAAVSRLPALLRCTCASSLHTHVKKQVNAVSTTFYPLPEPFSGTKREVYNTQPVTPLLNASTAPHVSRRYVQMRARSIAQTHSKHTHHTASALPSPHLPAHHQHRRRWHVPPAAPGAWPGRGCSCPGPGCCRRPPTQSAAAGTRVNTGVTIGEAFAAFIACAMFAKHSCTRDAAQRMCKRSQQKNTAGRCL